MKAIFVTKKELREYILTSKRSNSIRYFWKHILRRVPSPLKREINTRLVQLVEKDPKDFGVFDVIPYQFEPQGSSEELITYLKQFIVYVSDYRNHTDNNDDLNERIEREKARMNNHFFSTHHSLLRSRNGKNDITHNE